MYLELQSGGTKFPGESWLWGNHDRRVVVDLGYNELGRRAGYFSPHVLILTHDDSDHVSIKRVDQFKKALFDCRNCLAPIPELWLPLDWWRLIYALDRYDPKVKDNRGAESPFVDDGGESRVDYGLFEECHVPVNLSEVREKENRKFEWGGGGTPIQIDLDLERIQNLVCDPELRKEIERNAEKYIERTRQQRPRGGSGRSDGETDGGTVAKEIAKRLVKSSRTIISVIDLAVNLGANVRWFDYDLAESGCTPCWRMEGIPGLVTILNAREVYPVVAATQKNVGLFSLIRAADITIQNQRALATYLWPSYGKRDGVIIWSDTQAKISGKRDLVWPLVPWKDVRIMSAPHHASRSKDHQGIWDYRPKDTFVVLSNNSQECSVEWKKIDGGQRRCIRCARNEGSALYFTDSLPYASQPFSHLPQSRLWCCFSHSTEPSFLCYPDHYFSHFTINCPATEGYLITCSTIGPCAHCK